MLTDDELRLIRLFRNLSPENKIKLLETASIEGVPPDLEFSVCLAQNFAGTEEGA